ncbi:ribosome maturation factor RimM [Breznakiellaceae bacterium SP9]
MLEQFVIGIVGSAYGLSGFCKVKSCSLEIEHFKNLKTVLLRQCGIEKTYRVDGIQVLADTIVLKFAGTDSPEAVKALSGAEIVVPRAYAAPLQSGEYYIEDLKGLTLVASDRGEPLGRITAIVEGGGGFLAEVQVPSGDCKFVPFRNEFIGEINFEKETIELREQWILE